MGQSREVAFTVFHGTWREMCDQDHKLTAPFDQYFEIVPEAKRVSLKLRKRDDLKADKLIPTDYRGPVGGISRLVAVLDERKQRHMHFTVPPEAWRNFVREFLGREPNIGHFREKDWDQYDVILRDTNQHSHVIYLRVQLLNRVCLDDGRVGRFFETVTSAFLRYNGMR